MKFKIIATAHLFIIQNNFILLQKREYSSYEKSNFNMIGGHLETDETLKQCLIRECREETTLEINDDNLSFIQVLHRNKENDKDESRVDFFF